MSKLTKHNLLTVEIHIYREIDIHIYVLGGLSTLKYKHIFSTVSNTDRMSTHRTISGFVMFVHVEVGFITRPAAPVTMYRGISFIVHRGNLLYHPYTFWI